MNDKTMKDNKNMELEELRAQYQLLSEKLKTQNIISNQVISETTRGAVLGMRKRVRKDWGMPLLYLLFPLWMIPMVLLLTVPLSITIVELVKHHQWPDYGAYWSDLVNTSWAEWCEGISLNSTPAVWLSAAFIMIFGVYYLIWVVWESTLVGRLERMLCDGSTAAEIGRYAKDVYRQFHSKKLAWINNIFLIIMAVLFFINSVMEFGLNSGMTCFWIGFIIFVIVMIPRSLKRVQKGGFDSPLKAAAPLSKMSPKKGMDYHLLQIIRETEGINEAE